MNEINGILEILTRIIDILEKQTTINNYIFFCVIILFILTLYLLFKTLSLEKKIKKLGNFQKNYAGIYKKE